MQYIVVDLEWNQPTSYDSSVYKRVGSKLIFEMIQIGAVKLDEQLNLLDERSILIRPQEYVRVHPRIRRMTGLGAEELADAPTFQEAMAQFLDWCGEDAVLLTWGCDDISVWQQNMDYWQVKETLPPFYDLQRFFSDIRQIKERKSLQSAMELLDIQTEEERAFHNALHDAYYTALVFRATGQADKVFDYGQRPKQLIHARPKAGKTEAFPTAEAAMASDLALSPICPVCGKPAALDGAYIPQSADKWIALAKCPKHGAMIVRLRLRADEDAWQMHVKLSRASAMDVAYLHTKQLQLQNRRDTDAPVRATALEEERHGR